MYQWEKFFSLEGKIFLTREKNFSHFWFFSTFSMLFSLFYCDSFGFIRGKTHKIEKSNLFISFSLFSVLKFFPCSSKIFQNGSLGTKNGPSDPFKISRFTRNFKIGSSGPFLVPLEPFWNFSHWRKKFSHCQKRKWNEQSTIPWWEEFHWNLDLCCPFRPS